ncbi:hypothetical protein CAXC1_220069 [Candidatus Xenohaliotis californiensis]|uniref:Uncharacterized protein n=1 Tax=Candidatus Xenohaliotis californiensis TaxID=84677 RepID=A0ABM9N7S8_9RICK|nr:hypothetical protein CAXC1_220069 [Candidatus Xenohaliotis californiensis]
MIFFFLNTLVGGIGQFLRHFKETYDHLFSGNIKDIFKSLQIANIINFSFFNVDQNTVFKQ